MRLFSEEEEQRERIGRLLSGHDKALFDAYVTRVLWAPSMPFGLKVAEVGEELHIAIRASLSDKELASKVVSALSCYESYQRMRYRKESQGTVAAEVFCWDDLHGGSLVQGYLPRPVPPVISPRKQIPVPVETPQSAALARLERGDLGGPEHQKALDGFLDLALASSKSAPFAAKE